MFYKEIETLFLNLLRVTFLCLALVSQLAMSGELTKIEITATNNYQMSMVEDTQQPARIKDSELTSYVFERIKFTQFSDPQLFIEVMDWVASQWQHDGFNEAPKEMSSLEILKKVHEEGEQYRCVEYGKVMADILSSMGHHSRQIGLQSTDVAYGGWGQGHVATEVWSNQLNKWVFFDPQFSIYALYKGQYLNIYDIYQLKSQGLFEQIDFVVTSQYAKLNDIDLVEMQAEYQAFLSNYLGFHTSSRYLYGSKQSVYFMMEAELPVITFQGMGATRQRLFTKAVELAYPEINKTMITLSALPSDGEGFQSILEQYKIETEAQYIEHMWRFAAKGEVSMGFNSTMQALSHFQIRDKSHEWQDIEADQYSWTLTKGMNRFEIRSVSEEEVYGPVTFIEISYSN